MVEADFKAWLRYHVEAFPSLADWLKKNPGTVTFWEKPFSDVSLDDAKAATDEMASGELDEPNGYGKHPKVIAKRARQIGYGRRQSSAVVDGEQTYRCPKCLDEGFVAVVDPIHYRAGRLRPCSVLCTCCEGDRKAERRVDGKRRATPRFDKRRMCQWDPELSREEMQAEFDRWLRVGRLEAASGYEPAFTSYNEAG